MRKNREEKMLQCLDALEEVNEGLTGTLRQCVNIIDRFLPLGDHEINPHSRSSRLYRGTRRERLIGLQK